MSDDLDYKQKITELSSKIAELEQKNKKLLEGQVKLGEVTNNYLMLHYLNKNINECRISQKMWETYLHNITDFGFNYDNAYILLESEDESTFNQKLSLDNISGTLAVSKIDFTALPNYIINTVSTKISSSSEENTSVAIPITSGVILRGILIVFKNTGITFEDIELLEIYSQQTVSTVENITLNERLMSNQELLGEKINQFIMLHYVSKEIHDSKRYYNVLEKYLSAITSDIGFGFMNASLYVLDNQIQKVILYKNKLQFEKIKHIDKEYVNAAISKKYHVLSSDEKSLALPLISFNNIVAVIDIEHNAEIQQESIQLLEIFAMQTSSMLLNTKLMYNLQSEVEKRTAELNNAYTELKKLDAMKDEFLAMVSHELRTPLTSIMAYLETILSSLDDDSLDEDTQKSFLDIIYNESNRLKVIVDDVLDLSKLEAGKMNFLNEDIDIDNLLETACNNIFIQASNKNITLIKDFSKDKKIVHVDSTRIMQVISNILSNALKFTHENNTITISSMSEGDFVYFRITDTGIGIKPEDSNKVFSRFEQIENIEHHSKGTGLGMPISKMIIEAQKGEISFNSEYGKGTTFIVKLPYIK